MTLSSLLINRGMDANPAPGSKVCFKCQHEKPLSEFYAHHMMKDGHLNKCKDCTKRDVGKNYRDHVEQFREYELNRARDPERKEKQAAYNKAGKLRNPEKVQARNAVSNAIRDGRLVPQPCEICGSRMVQAHHDDYSKPLDVRWLCFIHHRQVHGQDAVAVPENLMTKVSAAE